MKKLIVLFLCSAIAMAGCGSQSSGVNAEATGSGEVSAEASSENTEAESAAADSMADSTESDASAIDVSAIEDYKFETLTYTDYVDLAEYKGHTVGELPEGTPIEEGMVADIDYVGRIDGEEFEGGSAQGHELTIGSHTFIDDFEDQLVGHTAGETVDVTVTFPEEYQAEELQGKEAVFTCTINSVSCKVEDAFTRIVEESEIKEYPESLMEEWRDYINSYYEYYAEMYEQELDEFKESYAVTDEMIDDSAKGYTGYELVACAILEAEGLTSESEAYQKTMADTIAAAGYESKEAAYEASISAHDIAYSTEIQCALDIIKQYAA